MMVAEELLAGPGVLLSSSPCWHEEGSTARKHHETPAMDCDRARPFWVAWRGTGLVVEARCLLLPTAAAPARCHR